jgi:uncharacterized protein (TIGR00297 family)
LLKINLIESAYSELISNFLIGIFLSAAIAFFSLKFRFLTKKGSYAVFILAIIIFSLGAWKWTLPIFLFFILSSLLSKFRRLKNADIETYFEKSSRRDHYQVIANGGFAGILVIINYFAPSEFLYIIYVSSVAAVCADTWGTEIGTLFKSKTFNILNLKIVEPGTSGGISIPGIIGSLAGALLIGISSLFWIKLNKFNYIILISSAGFFGSIIDSILGASVQAQFKCKTCGKITERKIHCSNSTSHYKGFKWVNNDAVNLCAGISGGIVSIVLADLI